MVYISNVLCLPGLARDITIMASMYWFTETTITDCMLRKCEIGL